MSRDINPRDTLDYDPGERAYRAWYDGDSIAPSIAVVTVLEEIVGTDSTRRNPLYEVVEPKALDELCTKSAECHNESNHRTVEFTYLDHEVRIRSDGTIEVRPLPDVSGTED